MMPSRSKFEVHSCGVAGAGCSFDFLYGVPSLVRCADMGSREAPYT